jgi:exo-beta-1,3-glucanase (GH17 family)
MGGAICWVAFSPTHYQPDYGRMPGMDNLRADLRLLRKAGFSGLVTYTAKGILGEKLPQIAREEGFSHLIVGIWNPLDPEELQRAEAASKIEITKGFVMGNEGLYPKDDHPARYTICQLKERMNGLRRMTGKPVTTSEDSSAYERDRELAEIGDWIFPNAHPYWAGYSDPRQAFEWTRQFFRSLARAHTLPVVLKEVGLPTFSGPQGMDGEGAQAEYYRLLGSPSSSADKRIDFVYFEAFDQSWKKGAVENSWGLFRADGTPKKAVGYVCGNTPAPTDKDPIPGSKAPPAGSSGDRNSASRIVKADGPVWYVYKDFAASENRFEPSGVMGDIGDLTLDGDSRQKPFKGKTAMRAVYRPMGKAPNDCGYATPCKWAGVRWQYPTGNFGQLPDGYDLRGYRWLRFAARSDAPLKIKFLVGGTAGRYPDSITLPMAQTIDLTPEWREYAFDLQGADLSRIVSGFGFTVNWPDNGIQGAGQKKMVIDIDEVRFER